LGGAAFKPVDATSVLPGCALASADRPMRSIEDFVESITDEFSTFDRDWRFIYLNEAALKSIRQATGQPLTRQDVLGRNVWELLPAHVGSTFHEKYHEAVREQKSVHFEARSPVTGIWIRANAYPSSQGLCVYCQDLTGPKQHEETLAYHAYLLDNVYDAVIATDEQLLITAWNNAAKEMYGWTADEVLGRHFWEAVPVALSEAQRADALRELRDTGRYRSETMTYGKDGVQVYVEGITMALRRNHAESGAVTGYVNIRRNITERKQTEEKLRRSEAQMKEAQRLGHVGSWMWNVATGECEWSEEHFHLFGLDPKTFTPVVENTQRLIHPDDLPVVQRVLEAAIRDTRDFEVDYRIVWPDGSIRYHRGIGHPIVGPPGDLAFVGVCVDLTERTQVERLLRRSEAILAEGQRISHTGSWALNLSTGELFWSVEHYRICGLDPEVPLTALMARQTIHPDDRASASRAFDNAVEERQRFEQEFRVLRPDGTVRHAHSVGHPVFDEAGDLTEYVGTIMDITARKDEEAARKVLLRRLIAAQEDERRRISREMHDELGQQLNLLMLELARFRREHTGNPELDGQLSSLETTVRTLDVDLDFLIWQLRPTALDDLGLVGALQDHAGHWSAHAGIAADWHESGMDHVRLTAEIEITLYRLLQEALNNVGKHARAHHVAILLQGHPDHVSLIVEDDGIGFEASEAFGPRHHGLGLIGMRERAALLGGTVDIESHPGDGTTFVARIPAGAHDAGTATS
jgi:PAS domain S-box-containing protein